MALTIKHTKVSTIPDGTDTSVVRPSDWNADHALTGVASVAQGGTGVATLSGILKGNGTGNVTAATGAEIVAAIGGTQVANAINADIATTLNGILGIADGGTNATTAPAALNNLLPTQTGQSGKVLGTDGTNATWVAGGGGAGVTQIVAGANIIIDPPSGTGTVTISTGGGSTLLGQTQSVSPYETSLGFEAGNSNTGANNTYFGYQAGKAMTGATNNVIIGYQAMDVATIPSSNVVIGSGACTSTSNTSQNVVIGYNAASSTTSLGGDSVIIGNDAGRTVTGTSNVLIGSSCGNNVSTGAQMVGVGLGCFGAATAPANGAVAVGNNALGALTTGAGNVGLGFNASALLTTGSRNITLGFSAGAANILGNDNTFLGHLAGTLVTASGNTYIGSGAGDAATSGANNTAVGLNAAGILTTGSSNTLIGNGAGGAITTGGGNTIIGGYTGTATLAGQVVLSDGTGNIRQAFNNNGAMSFDGTNFGSNGFVLSSNSTTNRPTWVNPRVNAVANFAVDVSTLPNIDVYFMNCTTGDITVTLPAANLNVGLQVTVKRVDSASANTLTVASVAGQIEGLVTTTIGIGVGVVFCSDGTNWWELSNS